VWLESLEGGIDYLRKVIIDDKLGINDQLEAEIARLRDAVICEWKETVEHPETQLRFVPLHQQPAARSECAGGGRTRPAPPGAP
jgi:assimilatory nitrite reductase (NAD(P)H) large subunit precursor (EC 1.7.1.4)